MANNYLNRYAWLIDVIRRHEYITLTDISDLWERSALNDTGGPLPERTFHNHRKSIEEIFGIEIKFNKARGYYLAGSDELSSEMNDWLLTSLAVSAAMNECKDLKDRILFAEMPSGKRFLTSIINAMKGEQDDRGGSSGFRSTRPEGLSAVSILCEGFQQSLVCAGKGQREGHSQEFRA